jgi:hypothetical protein
MMVTCSSTLAKAEPRVDYFIDTRGHRVEFKPVYEGWFGDGRYRPNYGRAIGENATMLVFELFLYWYDPNQNSVDWQYPNLGQKFSSGEVVRFDDNMQLTNFLLHPLAGGAHYGLSRLNGLGVPASFATAAISSGIYETILEWREVVSINDLIVTPFAGTAVGEMLYQLGNYLNSESHRPKTLDEVTGGGEFGRRLATVTVGLPRRGHDIVDQPRPPPAVVDDSLGLSSAYWHEFRLGAGVELARNDRGEAAQASVIREQTTLIAMPGFLRPGHISTWFWNGNFTSTSTKVAFNERLRDVDVSIDAHLFGHFEQHIDVDGKGLHGIAHELGGHTALHYAERWLLDRHDFYATLHLMGPTGTLWLPLGSARLRLDMDVAPDFAAIRSLAYEKWVALLGTEGTKSSLLLHGYYNAWGVSSGASATLSTKALNVSLAGRVGHYESIDGLERFQEKVYREPHNVDDILELSAGVAYEPVDSVVSARIEATHVGRASKMGPFSNPRYDETIGATLGARF